MADIVKAVKNEMTFEKILATAIQVYGACPSPNVEAAGGTPSHQKVRTNAQGIFKGSPPSKIEYIDIDRRIVDISCRPERTGTGRVRDHHGADESCRGRDRGINAYLSNETDVRLTLQVKTHTIIVMLTLLLEEL